MTAYLEIIQKRIEGLLSSPVYKKLCFFLFLDSVSQISLGIGSFSTDTYNTLSPAYNLENAFYSSVKLLTSNTVRVEGLTQEHDLRAVAVQCSNILFIYNIICPEDLSQPYSFSHYL